MKDDLKTRIKRKLGYDLTLWSKVIMNRECFKFIRELGPSELEALEISGREWQELGFKSYTNVDYPDFDICKDCLPQQFDVIIADQVFEHLLWPYRAGKNVYKMLKPGGYFIISTPFLVRVHNAPIDCSRWTETGLKYLLAECDFPLDRIETGSWGNRACINRNFKKWSARGWGLFTSLRNEPNFPITVWAIAQK